MMMKSFKDSSYLFGGNASFVEELYESYLSDPGSVTDAWRAYFDGMQSLPTPDGVAGRRDVAHLPVVEAFARLAQQGGAARTVSSSGIDEEFLRKQARVGALIAAYRTLGTRYAALDPLGIHERPNIPELDPVFYGFSESDMDVMFSVDSLSPSGRMTLRETVQFLRETYCGHIGFEFMHIADPEQRRWLEQRVESVRGVPQFDIETKRAILERLTAAETLELFLAKRYVGVKRFGLDGGESLLVAMDQVVRKSGEHGIDEVVLGMAHRGRLNLLVNTLGKVPSDLFAEFEGKHSDELSSGDVKYHQGFSSDLSTPAAPVHFTMAFNPSHLEIVNPVVEGSVRARQDKRLDVERGKVLPVLIHGDSAFAGQGVITETLQLSQTRYYGTGGTVHIVINNQIGFTTSDPRDARSTLNCTDTVKIVEAPVFHVNGDYPESVAFVMQLAMDFRKAFKKDVVVDVVCFRRLGHNEQDEPFVTQPLMYRKIAEHPGVRKLYADRLVAAGAIAQDEPENMILAYRQALDAGQHLYNPVSTVRERPYAIDWSPYLKQAYTDVCASGVEESRLKSLGARLTTIPEKVNLHRTVERVVSDRRQMYLGEKLLDWGAAENLAYATLLDDGFSIRISGQDCGRGTFSHRHAVLHDQKRQHWSEDPYIPLRHIKEDQPSFDVIDSILSEEAVLGFEYGYAAAQPTALVIWEAQFGDFANGAQVLFDQFISSGEAKWGRLCGLVCLLPHGYEGQGPEHSSARLERYLQLCAENNMEVCVPSNAGQIFHLLRRQMVRSQRRPLIVMTPKSLLRKAEAAVPLSQLVNGCFQMVIPDALTLDSKQVTRVLACSGKVYYDLLAYRQEQDLKDVAILRVEQLYPFPREALSAELAKYPRAKQFVWVQEESKNMGAWFQIRHNLEACVLPDQTLLYAGRAVSASPAVGYTSVHNQQQKQLVVDAYTLV